MIALEDFKLQPGDVVSFYARAKDARTETMSDMMFLEAQPFEREYSAVAADGRRRRWRRRRGRRASVTQRQKEIIAATFNQIRDKSQGRGGRGKENAKFLSEMQAKLRDQSKSLAQRMRSRELAAAERRVPVVRKGHGSGGQGDGRSGRQAEDAEWKDAIPPEQKALQHLLRAEATRRQIQVAFGRSGGGGGGGGGAGRDLESLFDLELDTEKNQYETGAAERIGGSARQREIDEALQKLEQLAQRQQELAQQQRDQKQTPAAALAAGDASPRSGRAEEEDGGAGARTSPGQQGQVQPTRSAGTARPAGTTGAARPERSERAAEPAEQPASSGDRAALASHRRHAPGRQLAGESAASRISGSPPCRRSSERSQRFVSGMRQQESGEQMGDLAAVKPRNSRSARSSSSTS